VHRYTAFGLQIDCSWELPDLSPGEPGSGMADVTIASVPITPPPAPVNIVERNADGWFTTQPGDTLYVYPGLARYRVLHGSRIEVDADAGVDEALVRHVLLGPVMATLLWQRELLVLHAGVISVGGRTCAFMANSGEGKSTLSSALYARGHRMLSDDVAVLPWNRESIEVLPGYPRMKVYPEVLTQVGVDLEGKPRIHAGIEKLAFMAEGLPQEPQRLDALYLLARGEVEQVRRLALPQALLVLMAQTYRPNQQIAYVGRQELMRRCARVAQILPVFVLERPRDLSRLDLLARFIEAHVAQLA
jgi:hypothetical protein